MSTKAFGRRIEVNLNGKLITEEMKLTFKVQKDGTGKPNTAELEIWNLSQETRAALQTKYLPTSIMAGYGENIGLIFNGKMRNPQPQRQGTDIITKLQAGDGEQEIRTSRINKSYAGGTKLVAVFKDIVKTIKDKGINTKDAEKIFDKIKLNGDMKEFATKFIASGLSWDVFQKLLATSGYEASVQDGNLLVVEKGKTTQDDAVLLNYQTGLIGSPEPGEKGIVKVRSLLNHTIYPGRKLQIQGQVNSKGEFGLDGFFKCKNVIFIGDTKGNDWYADVEALPL